MRTLGLLLLAVALASPVPARSAVLTAYLAPREGTAANGAGLDAAPSDVATPADWRRGVLGTEATDGGERSARDAVRRVDQPSRGAALRREEP